MARDQTTNKNKRRLSGRQRGVALVAILVIMSLIVILGTALLDLTLGGLRQARRDETRAVTFSIAESGVQRARLEFWIPFHTSENFNWTDANYTGATAAAPKGLVVGNLNNGRFAATIVDYKIVDRYTRDLIIRSVGWVDTNESGGANPTSGEFATCIRQRVRLSLAFAHVFDYVYFMNNYGWMTGFNQNSLWVNGDMRANGDFNITGGTVNGQIIAAANPDLKNSSTGFWGAAGVATVTNTTALPNLLYTAATAATNALPPVVGRARLAHLPLLHGVKGSATFASQVDSVYDQTPDPNYTVNTDIVYGAVIADTNNTRQLSDQSNILSTSVPDTLPMPNMTDMTYYRDQISATYRDPKASFSDGFPNFDYSDPPYIEVWNAKTFSYKRITGQNGDPPGTLSGSAALIGTLLTPVRVHGPVTVMGDIAIKGFVSGQATLYAGRNVHILGNVIYSTPPVLTGTNLALIDLLNERTSIIALCARGSVIMGNVKDFGSSPLDHMKPPFTQERRNDVTGVVTPAFNATVLDSGYSMQDGSGTPKKYQSLFGDNWIDANASPISQIDAIMYTNNCAGGLVGDGTITGFTINGSVISKDEAIITNTTGRMTLNYDTRIKERDMGALGKKPFIDIHLPRTPTMTLTGWSEVLP